jgi:hypothetical protein
MATRIKKYSLAVKTARVASLSALKGLSFPRTGYSL